ncbi:MAG: Wadjet anti-phage system protein JetD domain-containing protein [Pseudomonadota bacterium]
MEQLAQELLQRLLRQGEAHVASVRKSSPRLTAHDLATYRSTKSWTEKEAFESMMRHASSRGAIQFQVDDPHNPHSLIKRIEMADLAKLADFLGRPLQSIGIEVGAARLAPWVSAYPVLGECVTAWRLLKAPRNFGPESAQDFLDAVTALEYLRTSPVSGASELPLRVVSQTLFNDTKRLEQLAPALDILLAGALNISPRHSADIWQELGLLKVEQPALLAGQVVIARSRVSALLDMPYAGFPAAAVLAVESKPTLVLSLENLTTFHMEASKRCGDPVLLLYTAGMPSPQWRAMYRRILSSLPVETPIFHWGDIDEGGFRIAAKLAAEAKSAGRQLQPWNKMQPTSVPSALRVPAQTHTIDGMCRFAEQAGWQELCAPLREGAFTVEQEALIN